MTLLPKRSVSTREELSSSSQPDTVRTGLPPLLILLLSAYESIQLTAMHDLLDSEMASQLPSSAMTQIHIF